MLWKLSGYKGVKGVTGSHFLLLLADDLAARWMSSGRMIFRGKIDHRTYELL